MPTQANRDQNTQAPAFLGKQAGNLSMRNEGPVRYLDASEIGSTIEFPRSERKKLLPILAIAIIISAALIFAYNATVSQDVARTQALVEEALDRDVSLDLPVMREFAGKSNEDMMKAFHESGYNIYDNSNEEDRNVDGFDVFKIASDLDPDVAAAAYADGLENMGPVDQARYLLGSWRFIVSRVNDAELRLRYADFDSTDAKEAIAAAIESQGFEDADIADIAEDTMGNKNLSGTFEKGKKKYEYTISACDLSQVYEIEGAPENAQFVGIRVNVAN